MNNKVFELHKQEYGVAPEVVVSAPGVISLLGEVSDCNDGYVLQCAIDRRIYLSVSARPDSTLKVFSENLDDRKKAGISTIKFKSEDKWLNYLKGVLSELALLGYDFSGFNVTVSGNIPHSLALGSSSALCVAFAAALRNIMNYDLTDIQLIQCAYLAESRFMNIKSSMTDCLTAYYAQAGKMMFFDLRTIDYKNIDFPIADEIGLFVTNSNIPVISTDDEEAERDQDCLESLEFLKDVRSGHSLRDYSESDIKQAIGNIPEHIRRLSMHVVLENQRVLDAAEVITEHKYEMFGRILNRSHESLRDNFEVSCPEVDWLVKRSHEIEGVLGSRLLGKGSGGCIFSMINKSSLEDYNEKLKDYESIFGFKADLFSVKLEDGLRIEKLED